MKTGMLKLLAAIGTFFLLLFLLCFYRVFYKEETIHEHVFDNEKDEHVEETKIERGYYIRKRIWILALLTPLIFPLFVAALIPFYINWIISHPSTCIHLEHSIKSPDFRTRLIIRYQIFKTL